MSVSDAPGAAPPARRRYRDARVGTADPFGQPQEFANAVARTRPVLLPVLRYDRSLQALTALAVVAYSLSTFLVARPTGYNTFWDLWVEDIAFALPAVPMVLAARRWPQVRVPWLLIAAGTVLNTMANLVYTLHDQNVVPFPSPAPSDYLYISSYLVIIAGLAVLTQRRVGATHLSLRLDGAIMALSLASLAGTLWFEPLLQASGRPAVVIVTLAYPLCDLVMLILLVAGLSPNRFRPDLQTSLFMVGVIWFVVGDVIYLRQVNAGTYVTGTFLDATWVIGFWVMGIAASVRPRRRRLDRDGASKTAPRGLTGVPVGSGVLSLVVLVVAYARHDRSVIVLGLALASLWLVMVRMWMTLREEGKLAASSTADARTDALTGLANRRALLERIERLVAESEGTAGVVLLDLDGFKEVNDALGHFAGDELLTELARRFDRGFSHLGTVARLGGDEFAFAGLVAGEQALVEVAQGLIGALDEPYVLDEVPIRVGASAGVAIASGTTSSAIDLLRGADVAMYEAKRTDAQVCVYRPSDDPNTRERLTLLGDLRTAIDREDIELHFQPVVDLRTGEVVGVEALARWRHKERGLLHPDAFIPVAERVGLMPRLTRVVIDRALAEAARLESLGHHLRMSINLSRRDLADETLPDALEELLTIHGMQPTSVTVEVTEAAIGSEPERAAAQLARLRAKQVQVSIDDFGVGYSSMAQLRDLEIEELKIDRTFVIGLHEDARALAIVHSAVDLAGSLGLRVVAEGIEDESTRRLLAGVGARLGQGYHLCRPLPAVALEAFVASSNSARLSSPLGAAT